MKPKTRTITINRRTKVGYNIEAYPTPIVDDFGNSGFYFETPTAPYWTGTIKTLFRAIHNEPFLRSIRSGGTHHSEAYFIKQDGKWYRVVNPDDMPSAWRYLLMGYHDYNNYECWYPATSLSTYDVEVEIKPTEVEE